jgi:catechol 2,3-dioxygenase-like lactoylglutathione lyase family enzyme
MPAFDHVALEVPDLDATVEFLTSKGLMRLIRHGVRTGTGQRIAMLADEHGQKLELIDGDGRPARLLHLAFEVDDVAATFADWVDDGSEPLREPHELAAAQATTGIVRTPFDLEVQVVRYATTSPDNTRRSP